MSLNKFFITAFALVSLLFLANCSKQNLEQKAKPRIVITADPELDDENSLIRLILYSSDMKIEGLIYASSGFHWKGDGKGTTGYVEGREYTRFGLHICPCTSYRWPEGEGFINQVVDAYAKVYPNLKVHDPDYPSPDTLRSKIRVGNVEFDGDYSKDSPGSGLIRKLILDNQPGPLYITAQGGESTIARALKSIQDQYENTAQWQAIKEKVSHKVILLPSGDQDDTYARYIKPNWPDIEARTFREGPRYAYGAQLHATPEDSVYLTAQWMRKNVTSKGPLGKLYRVWGDGKQMVKGDIFDYFGIAGHTNEELKKMGYIVWLPVQKKGSWLGEGDDPTFMNMLDNGLRAYEKGSYGGWGGVATGTVENIFTQALPKSASDTSLKAMMSVTSGMTTRHDSASDKPKYPDFFPAAQNDFAARLLWSVTPSYDSANHEPEVTIQGPLDITAAPGATVHLSGNVKDPDGNGVSPHWWQFHVGTYPGEVTLSDPYALNTDLTIPADAQTGQTIHIILQATDNGTPNLTSYQRVVITVEEKGK